MLSSISEALKLWVANSSKIWAQIEFFYFTNWLESKSHIDYRPNWSNKSQLWLTWAKGTLIPANIINQSVNKSSNPFNLCKFTDWHSTSIKHCVLKQEMLRGNLWTYMHSPCSLLHHNGMVPQNLDSSEMASYPRTWPASQLSQGPWRYCCLQVNRKQSWECNTSIPTSSVTPISSLFYNKQMGAMLAFSHLCWPAFGVLSYCN